MSRSYLPVDGLLSWARREAEVVRVGLRLPGADLAPGETEVRLARRKGDVRVDAEVTSEEDAVWLAFAVPQAEVGRVAWSIAVQSSTDGRFQPVEARLLAPKGQPVAVLTGPAPETKMSPPAPRQPGRAEVRTAPRPTRQAGREELRSAPSAPRQAGRKTPSDPTGERSGGRHHRRLSRRSPGPALQPRGPALRAVRAAGEHPVVVLTDLSTERAVAAWREELDADVTLIRLDDASRTGANTTGLDDISDLDGLDRRLIPIPPPAVLMVALSPASLGALSVDHLQLFARLFPYVRHGGAYVASAVPTEDDLPGPARDDALSAFRRALTEAAEAGTPVPPLGPRLPGDWKVVERPDFVLLRKTRRHAIHLREDQAGDLRSREPGTEVSILEVRPAGTLPVATSEITHGVRPGEPWPDRLSYPELAVRHYRGNFTSMGGMLLTSNSAILPESFRWPYYSLLATTAAPPVAANASRLRRVEDAAVLEGDYYFLDCRFSGHFGHVLTEVVTRLWGWDAAHKQLPDLKALFHTDSRRRTHGSLERKLFAAYGVPEPTLVSMDRPVRVRSVVGASPMWHNAPPFFVHPDLRDVWARLTSGLLAGRLPAEHERIFVSRGDDLSRRRCRNQAEVERFFADRGFHVFYPERLSLDEQVALFAGARVVAGFAGSAMFNMMHCRRLEKTIVISHSDYEARNENLFTSILGGEFHYFWQEPDDLLTRIDSSTKPRRASYAFDFDKYGADLAQVITEG